MAQIVGLDTAILPRKVKSLADENIHPGENVRFCLNGNNSQSLVALDERLLIVKVGFMAGASFGGRATSFNYSDISGVQVNTGLMTGTIEIHTPGLGATKASDFWSSKDKEDPFKLPNVLPINKGNVKVYQPYLEQLRSLIAAAKGSGAAAQPTAQPDLVAQLTQLKQLFDAGALTAEQYETAKEQLLSSTPPLPPSGTSPRNSPPPPPV